MAAYLIILRFPEDILLEILTNLDSRSLLICRTTCRRLNRIVSDSVLLQYRIELAACGMVDGRQTLDVAEKLRRLRLYNAAWNEVEWTGHTALPHLANYQPPSMASAGALVFHSATTSHNRSLTALQHVSSKLRCIHEQHIVFPVDVGFNSLIDPSQDLLAYAPRPDPPSATQPCHLLTFSTGLPHPLRTADPCADLGSRTLIEVCGEYILEAVCTHASLAAQSFNWNHIVWNWQTGRIALTLSHDSAAHGMMSFCRFLDASHVFTVEPGAGFDAPVCVKVYALDDARPLHSFLFPKLAPSSFGPMMPSLAYGGPHGAADAGCFHSDRAERLLSVRVASLHYPPAGFTHAFIDIPLETLRSYIAAHPASGGPVEVPWREWGQRTRVTRCNFGLWTGELIVNGMRRIDVRKAEDGDGLLLDVVDYHPRRVARALSRQRRGEGEGETVISQNDASTGGLADGLQSTLPCLVKSVPVPEEVVRELNNVQSLGACLCEDGVIFVKLGADRELVTKAWSYTF